MNYKLKNEEIIALNDNAQAEFPKYTSQLINLANNNAQGTRPKVVGSLTTLFSEFSEENGESKTIEDWRKWYLERNPDAFDKAIEKINIQVNNLRNAFSLIDEDLIRNWVEDLIINKTYNGLYVQKAILASLANLRETTYRLATPEEESKGIDGFVGGVAYSVKPDTYKTNRLPEEIDVKMIYYTKTKSGLNIEVTE